MGQQRKATARGGSRGKEKGGNTAKWSKTKSREISREITEGKGQNKKIAWRKPQRGDRGRHGVCARQLTKHNTVKSESSVPSVLLCVGHHCWILGLVLVLFYCPKGHFTF